MKTIKKFSFFLGIVFFFSACHFPKLPETNSEKNKNWELLGPGGGGSTFIPSYSFHSTDEFMIRCDMTGSYLSKNGGKSYQQINFPNGASCYAFDPNNSGTIYIGSSTLNRSVDGGKTWEQIFPRKDEVVKETFSGDHAELKISVSEGSLYKSDIGKIGCIRTDPTNKTALYFTMGNFFFYSHDNGNSWKQEELPIIPEYLYTNNSSLKNEVYIFSKEAILVFNKLSSKILQTKLPEDMIPSFSFSAGTVKNSGKIIFYALHNETIKENQFEFGHSEVWTSYDMGLSWEKLDDDLLTNEKSELKPSYTMIACSEEDAGNAYVVCNQFEEKKKNEPSVYWYGALKTSNAGESWNWVWKAGGGSGQYGVQDAQDADNLKDAWTHKAFGGEFIQLLDVGVSPKDGNSAIVTDWYRTMKTIDGGKSWSEIYSILNSDSSYTSRGMDVTTSYGVHFDPFDSSYIAISYTDIGYHQSFNGGMSWNRSVNGVPIEWVNTCYWLVFDPEIKGKLWSVWSNMHDFPRGKMTRNPNWKKWGRGGVCISYDGGKTWEPSIEGMGSNSPSTCIVLDPKSPPKNRTLYTCVYNKGIFKSINDGKTWQLKNNGIEENTCAFEITLASNGNLFLTVSPNPMHKGGKKGKAYFSGAVYKSVDGAESWTKLKVTDDPFFPNGMACDINNPDKIYLTSWADIDLSDLVGGDVVKANGGNEQIDLKGGIFMSADGGSSWTSIFDQNQYVYDITVDPYHPGRLYCNTFNKSAYRSDDEGKTWKKLKGYDFHWGQRIIVDENNPEKIYITTFGSSVWHGFPEVE